MQTSETLSHTCSRCSYVADRLTCAAADGKEPEAGDIAICIKCGFVDEFVEGAEDELRRKELTFNRMIEMTVKHTLDVSRLVNMTAELYRTYESEKL